MILVVTGGRDFEDRDYVLKVLDNLHKVHPIHIIFSGACVDPTTKGFRGVDRFAMEWAGANEIDFNGRPAKWSLFGKSAGPKRNTKMVVEASRDMRWGRHACLVFPGGRGTDHCRGVAMDAEFEIFNHADFVT